MDKNFYDAALVLGNLFGEWIPNVFFGILTVILFPITAFVDLLRF